jgi:hypothetical protein
MVVVQPRPGRRRRIRLAGVGIILVGALVAVNGPPLVNFVKKTYHDWKINTEAYKRKYGHWINLTIPADRQINAVHAVMLNTGKVLIMAGSGNNIGNFNAGKFESEIYNPANNTFKKIPTPYDMFCSGHYILPDGNVLIAGGTKRYEVLPSSIRYAAGVMTVENTSTREALVLKKGTVFESPQGQLYRATSSQSILPARRVWVKAGKGAKQVTQPSYTPLWVKAERKGQGPVSNVNRDYSILGLPATAAAALQASALAINRSQQNFWGTQKSYIFNVRTETYQKVSDMNLARWYPTLVGLKDGNVMAVSGLNQFGQIITGDSEVFNPKTQRWTLKPNLTKSFPTYPALFLMPNGDLFFTGATDGYGPDTPAWRTPGIWNPNTNAFTPVVQGLQDPKELETAGSIILPPAQDQRYAIIGGGGVGQSPRSTGRIDIVDLNSRDPSWKPDGKLPVGTRYPEVVITPTDGVVISGGSKYYRGMHGSDIMTAHMWMPNSGMLMEMASPLVGRDYHSEGLLLPDGRVLTLGGNPLFGNKEDTTPEIFHHQISIYSPPYLYQGPRPRITAGPSSVARGHAYTFTTPNASSIVKVRLMHPSAVTHVTDVQQRSIAVTFKRERGALKLTIPTNSGLIPSGYYMLFVDNSKGVPSVAKWVHVS